MSVSMAMLVVALLVTTPAGPAPELEPYRALARSSAAARMLEAAREGLCASLDECEPSAVALVEWPGAPRPVYVTLTRGRTTRACVGSDAPMGTLAETVRQLAARVADADRRRPPVRAGELDSLRLVIAFAGEGAAVADPYTIDPAREGLKVETEHGAVAFLPGEARTVRWALAEARRIGVLTGPLSEARCTRFPVVIIQGPAALPRTAHSEEPQP